MTSPQRALRHLRIVAMVEGISFVVLVFVAMPLKYMAGMPQPVSVTGAVHGGLFLLFLYTLYQAMTECDWPFRRTVMAFIASLVPFGMIPLDRSLRHELQRLPRP